MKKHISTHHHTARLLATSIAACTFALCGSISTSAIAAEDYDLEVTIAKRGQTNATQVAFVPFSGDSSISSVILNDLRTTPLTITSDNLIQTPHSSQELAGTLPSWQQLGIPYLVVGKTGSSQGNIVTEFEVIDLASARSVQGPQRISGKDSRRVAHATADRIYELLTGKKSDFSAKIAFIEEQGVGANKRSSLKIIDADGENPQTIAQVNGSIFSPAASPDGTKLAYSVQLPKNLPYIYIYDLNSKSVRPLVRLKGGNLSPSFSPDGGSILFSSTVDGDADIYAVSVSGGAPRKILDLPYDQVQPSYAPDGRSFVFTSDHASPNRPSIYRADFAGNISRLSRSGYAASPAYSPDGSKIGYLNGNSAAIMSNSGGNIANFGSTGIDESPRFSPSGEKVVYSQGRGRQGTLIIRPLNGGKTIGKTANGVIRSPVWIPSK